MILIYGKWKVGNGLSQFLQTTEQSYQITDDTELQINKDQKTLNPTQQQFLEKFDQIIMSPGIPPHHLIYQNYKNKTISVLNFLWDFIKKNRLSEQLILIGISGTNGKSTTTHVLYQLLQKIIEQTQLNTFQVHLSGNFGTPLSETLSTILTTKNTKTHIIVIECSSFMLYQLQNFNFDYSILTNIETDHLDRHPDKNDYHQAKVNLIKHTHKNSFTTTKVYQQLDTQLQSKTNTFDYNYDLRPTHFSGYHNQANLQSAYLLSKKLFEDYNIKIDDNTIKTTINTITPLAHRMQFYTQIDNVNIYDDAICTSAHAQENALKWLTHPIVLICWWYDKGDNFEHLANIYKKTVAYGVFIGDTAPQFEIIFQQQNIPHSTQTTLHQAIQEAFNYAKKHHTDIVFSPWCASFWMFRNVYHRIEEFEKEIKLLKTNTTKTN